MIRATLVSCLLLAVASTALAQQESYNQDGLNNSTLSADYYSYTDATGADLRGYFAYDTTTNDKRGLVLIVPDWDGIGEYEKWRAELLAGLGYAAFVADIYTTSVQQGPSLPMANRSQLTMRYSGNQTLLVTRMNGALDTAKQQPVVDPTKIVAIGYCFGGGAVMQLARSWPSSSVSGLLGVVSFHGSQLAQKTGDRNFTEGNPINVVINNGYLDPSNNATQIASIKAELQKALVSFAFVDYGETVHAFTEPNLAPWSPATTGTQAYTEFADVLSWNGLRTFLLYKFGYLSQGNLKYLPDPGMWDTRTVATA